MIVVGTLLVVLVVISDGATIHNEFGISDCNCHDNSEECKQHCANANSRSERDNVHCPVKVLPPNTHCDRVLNNGSYCDNDLPFVGSPVNYNDCDNVPEYQCAWNPCCFEAHCPLSPDYTPVSGGSVLVENVNISWSLYNGNMPKMLISWSQSSPVGGYQLFIATKNSTNDEEFKLYLDRCTCLNSSIRYYSAVVGKNYEEKQIQLKLVSLISVNNDFDHNTVTRTVTVPECWSIPGAYSKLCPKLPTAPRNLSVTVVPLNDSSVTLQISWKQPAAYLPDIILYRIKIYVGNDTECTYLYTNGSTLHCSAMVNVSTSYEVMVDSSNSIEPTKTHENCYLIGDNCNAGKFPFGCYYCWGDRADVIEIPNNTTPTAITDESSTNNQLTLIAALSGSGTLLLLFTTMAVLILMYRTYLHKRSKAYITLREVASLTPSPVTSAKVFIINSPQSSDEDLRLVRNLCHNLADNAVEPIAYDYDSGPSQSGIHDWMKNNFAECDMILIVCNKSFYDAWNSNDSEQNAVVSASKQLLQGHLISNDNISKLAIVLLREHDRQYIPSLYLRNLTTFVVFSDGHCDEEDLVRYILQVPRFIRPPVRDATVTVASLTENTV